MRLLIAPDSFKGSCPARAVAAALERGAKRAAAAAGVALEVRQRPLSDGGEGMVDALASTLKGERRRASVRAVDLRAQNERREAEWLWVPKTCTAFGEAAEVVGFQATAVSTPSERTALGIGDYLGEMRSAGARTIVLGIGGTSTVDGGASVAQALGGVFRSAEGPYPVATLLDAERAVTFEPGTPWPEVEVVCWADVVTPLVGEGGAVPTFAPQKGATPELVTDLQRAAETWGRLAQAATGVAPDAPGTGAGGGIPFGLMLTLGARIESGAARVAELLGLTDDVRWADLVWTGEGRLDKTTLEGKLVHRLLDWAADFTTPAAVIAGQVADRASLALAGAETHSLIETGASVERCLREAPALLEQTAESVLRDWLARRDGRGGER